MPEPCRLCQQGRRITTLTFALFAVLLSLAALDPEKTLLYRSLMYVCAGLSGIAVFRFAIASVVARHLQHTGRTPRSHGTQPK